MGKKVYISMPMTGLEDTIWERFQAMVKYVRETPGYEDCELVIPVGVEEFENPERAKQENKSWGWYMGRDIEQLADSGCTDIFFAEGWQHSKGCCLEKAAAEILGINRTYWQKRM